MAWNSFYFGDTVGNDHHECCIGKEGRDDNEKEEHGRNSSGKQDVDHGSAVGKKDDAPADDIASLSEVRVVETWKDLDGHVYL